MKLNVLIRRTRKVVKKLEGSLSKYSDQCVIVKSSEVIEPEGRLVVVLYEEEEPILPII